MNEEKREILNIPSSINDQSIDNDDNIDRKLNDDNNVQKNNRNHVKIISRDEQKFTISIETAKKFGLIRDWLNFNPDDDEEFRSMRDSEEIKWLLFLEEYTPRINVEDYFGCSIKKLKDDCIFTNFFSDSWNSDNITLNFCFL